MRICLATNNAHKIIEVQTILGKEFPLVSLADVGCKEELPETQNSISGNSLQKAQYVFNHYHIASLADDSGLEVFSLNGAPGVDSAHFAGPQRSAEDNINLLLEKMKRVSNRAAQFKTILTLQLTNGGAHQFEGILTGVILTEKKGRNGFGYDPVFLPDGYTHSLAEMTLEEKNKISHRAKAVQKLLSFLTSASID